MGIDQRYPLLPTVDIPQPVDIMGQTLILQVKLEGWVARPAEHCFACEDEERKAAETRESRLTLQWAGYANTTLTGNLTSHLVCI